MQPPPSRGDTTAAALTGITPAAAAGLSPAARIWGDRGFDSAFRSLVIASNRAILARAVALSFLRLREGGDYYPMILGL
jgi:hypothetical protein